MMSTTRSSCMNVDDTVSVGSAAAVGVAATPSTTAMPEFVHLTETRRYIYRAIAAIHEDSFNNVMNRLLRRFESAIREELECAQNSPLICRKLARSIIGLSDLIYTLIGSRNCSSWNLSRDRWCYIVANYIACELCAAQDRTERDQCIIERIGSMLSLYVEGDEAGSNVHKENTLRTLIAIPKLFGQANIITVFYSRLFPQWSSTYGLFSQTELPDKIYIEYIIIFYYWQRLECNELTKKRIFDFAIKFMRPACTLPCNPAYIEHLPKYSSPSTATRCILEHLSLKQCCRGLHYASKMDNRTVQPAELILDSDEEDSNSETSLVLVSALFLTATATQQPPPPAPDPPDFLKRLCRHASQLEPVKRATALYRGIDSSVEVVDLCESDEEEEMFSLDFSVPATVDGSGSNSNESAGVADDDYVPITRIYPINLRTYQRATSSSASVSTPAATYTVPRIVNSYSCRRDSLHLVSTTQMPPHLVDQCVQTAGQEEVEGEEERIDEEEGVALATADEEDVQQAELDEEEADQQLQHEELDLEQMEPQLQHHHRRHLNFNDDAVSSCIIYSDTALSASPTTTTGVLYETSYTRRKCSQTATTKLNPNDNHHCHQTSSRNSHSSETSLHKKQVTFSAQPLGASKKTQLSKSLQSIKPSIKCYKRINNSTSLTSLTAPSPNMDFIESLKWMGRKEHLLAGQRMFSKLESRKNRDRRNTESLSSCSHRMHPDKPARSAAATTPTPTSQLTPTTSNASSGTPTPQPKRLPPRGAQRSLPTPPASTHSSLEACRHRKSSDSAQNSIDAELKALAKKYKFDRRKFSEFSPEHVDLYKSLLKLQRRKMREIRQTIGTTTVATTAIRSPSELELKLKKRLHDSNVELRKDIEQLESDVECIKSYAAQMEARAREKAATTKTTSIAPLLKPIVRLKRVHVEELLVSRRKPEDIEKKPKLTKRRRRKQHCWSRLKKVTRKKCESHHDQQQEISNETESPALPDDIVTVAEAVVDVVADTAVIEDSVAISVREPSPANSVSLSTHTDAVPSPVPADLEPPAPASIPNDPDAAAVASSPVPDCIAAYVTLTNNGESCSEEEAAVIPPIGRQVCPPSPALESSSVIAAHEIEVASSNVPVYLLNGESRDVTTPVPTVLASDLAMNEPHHS